MIVNYIIEIIEISTIIERNAEDFQICFKYILSIPMLKKTKKNILYNLYLVASEHIDEKMKDHNPYI